MAKVHNDLLVNHNQIHSAIGNDKLADARDLMCASIRMIDTALGGKTEMSIVEFVELLLEVGYRLRAVSLLRRSLPILTGSR